MVTVLKARFAKQGDKCIALSLMHLKLSRFQNKDKSENTFI